MRNKKNFLKPVALSALLLIPALAPLHAENWPHWRGPNYDGSTKEEKLPDDFSKTNNVKWVASLPGPSAATPIIWGDHVFVSTTDKAARTVRALALDRKTGKVLWNHEIAQGFNQDDRSNFASPSPVTDGKLVYFLYGTGDLVAFDFTGKKVWAKNIQTDYGQFAMLWTYSSSPTLVDGKLFIQVLQRDSIVSGRGPKEGPIDSYLLALDARSGKEIWKHVRACDAVAESREAFTTPIPLISYIDDGRFSGPDGKPPTGGLPISEFQLVISGGDCVTAHDGKTGKEIWRWGTWNPAKISHWRLVQSPVVGARLVVVCAPKNEAMHAIKLGRKDTLDDSAVAWKTERNDLANDVSTPLFYQNRFYLVSGDRAVKTIAAIHPKTGKADWTGELPTRAKIESSPTGADGKIYFMSFRGEVFIVAAGEKFELLRTIPMGDAGDDNLRSSIAAAQGNLFIRTGSKLYCVGK